MLFMSITEQQFFNASKIIGCKISAIKAVYEVEAAGRGYLPDGRVKILFEGHRFWKRLSKVGKVPDTELVKQAKLREEGNTYNTKTMVMGLLERGGDLKLINIGNSNNSTAIKPTVKDNVNESALVITDSLGSYTGLNKTFAGHEVVNHREQEYVREGNIHTNSIEGAFSLLKRSIIGIYHQVTPKHLSRYCDETMFRYNLRKMKDADRFTLSLNYITGRLTYKDLIQKELEQNYISDKSINAANYIKGKRRPVVQLKDGEIVAKFESVSAASRELNITESMIRRVLKGVTRQTHGFQWKYL